MNEIIKQILETFEDSRNALILLGGVLCLIGFGAASVLGLELNDYRLSAALLLGLGFLVTPFLASTNKPWVLYLFILFVVSALGLYGAGMMFHPNQSLIERIEALENRESIRGLYQTDENGDCRSGNDYLGPGKVCGCPPNYDNKPAGITQENHTIWYCAAMNRP